MTRKDYISLSLALQASRPNSRLNASDDISYNQWRADVQVIAVTLKTDNQRFDVPRFVQDCGASV